ncbi:2-oxoglutarate-dependent dioxygenase htyE-like [Venturia canescens]|uniref:2-oxoglutarate-dependent dioxygenase htyE-like n=1 Tax=Venturia canescens TaxID=32260 RepID=UPI001C9C23F0|nr:2-oxoglutarate-dependent dioxygenase htyE-like [Venturia canescens]
MSCTSAPSTVAKKCETLLSKCEIPIIDLGHMGLERCPQKGVVKQVASKLVRALSEKGLAFIVNHGIPDCKMKAVYRALDEFCVLPADSRAKYECVAPSSHGYVKPEVEDPSSPADKEARHAFIITGDTEVLPEDEVPGFRAAVEELSRDFKQLSGMLLQALSVGLEQPPEFLPSKHAHMLKEGNETALRLLYYPPSGVVESSLTHYGARCDYGTFTLLAQDRESGLEIQTLSGGRWERVGHLTGAILIKTGDKLASWTNQQFQTLKHRIVVPEQYGRGRHSIAFFVHPDKDTTIEPLETKIATASGQEPVLCRMEKKKRGVMTAYHHLQRRFRETYAS